MKQAMIFMIKVYQRIPGPWHSYCRHIPTCSDYAIEAYTKHGFFKGTYFTIKRVLKCNPFGTSGYDKVPDKKENLK